MRALFATLAAVHLYAIDAVSDNALAGEPVPFCGPDTIGLNFETQKPFAGHVFIKEHFVEPECRYTSDTEAERKNSMAELHVAFETCGVERRRTNTPVPGIFVSTTMIIAFDSLLLTKRDRAYMITCFYMEAEKIVMTELEIRYLMNVKDGSKKHYSMLTTQFHTEQVPMPVCRYEVLDAPNGESVSFANIGQPVRRAFVSAYLSNKLVICKVWHKWTCESEQPEVFCMLVHSCHVDDGAGDIIELLDKRGCALDANLLDNLDYVTNLMAIKDSHVFKYYDRPNLFFDCQITIHIREPNLPCEKPQCAPALRRGKRATIDRRSVRSETFNISHHVHGASKSLGDRRSNNVPGYGVEQRRIIDYIIETPRSNSTVLCLPSLHIAAYATCCAILLIASAALGAGAIALIRRRQKSMHYGL